MFTSVHQLIESMSLPGVKTTQCAIYKLKISFINTQKIVAALRKKEFYLQDFSLLRCDLSDECALLLAEALQQCPNLKSITISHCTSLTAKGALAFMSCKQILVLTLNAMGIEDDTLKTIAANLRTNTTLSELHLANNFLHSVEPLCDLLQSNLTLTNINVANNPFSTSTNRGSQVINTSCNKLMTLVNDNHHWQNISNYHAIKANRVLYNYYLTFHALPQDCISVSVLKPVYDFYGLSILPARLENELIYFVYLIQTTREIFRSLSSTFVNFITDKIVDYLLNADKEAKPPVKYTNTLANLNHQKQKLLEKQDYHALHDNFKARWKMSLFPISVIYPEPITQKTITHRI